MKAKTESKRYVDLERDAPIVAPRETESKWSLSKPRAFADFSPDEQAALLMRYVAGGHEDLPMLAPEAIKGIVREYLIAKGHRDVPMVGV